jgi:hypothetical protein
MEFQDIHIARDTQKVTNNTIKNVKDNERI